MISINELVLQLEQLAPLSLSEACINNGSYDNSGVLINCTNQAQKILFSLDLSLETVKKAKKLKCDTIVTHHPAIYLPLKSLSVNSIENKPLLEAIVNQINVISFHLNLDVANDGIDQSLSIGLGGQDIEILTSLTSENGYGRRARLQPEKFSEFIKNAQRVFETSKLISYGDLDEQITSFASFCGAGGGDIQNLLNDNKLAVDLVVSSDLAHHVIKELVERGYKILILPHYVAEDYGFKKFFESATKLIKKKAKTYYFSDKRFK